MILVDDVMRRLAIERPVFHSEADFQHAFALVLHRQYPACLVRLELPIRTNDGPIHLDLWATFENDAVAIELKYKTRALSTTIDGEQFTLLDHSALDTGRYDFIKDVERLETLVHLRPGLVGYAVLLTNDSDYWSVGRNPGSMDAAFRIGPGRDLSGALNWNPRSGAGTKRGRERPLSIRGNYGLMWRDYSQVNSARYFTFRYLAVAVGLPGTGNIADASV